MSAASDELQAFQVPPCLNHSAEGSLIAGAERTQPSALHLHYRVAMPEPASHLFEVTLEIQGWQSAVLDLKLPVWTPGSYLVREYARHIQDLVVQSPPSATCRKLSKNHWQVQAGQSFSAATVRYRVFANELSVRTNHLDVTHGYFNGAALFFFLPGCLNIPITVTVEPPQANWRVTTPLPAVLGRANTFLAADFDTLVDSPFEIGSHPIYPFEVLGKSHQLAVWGQGNLDPQQVIQDTQKIIRVEAELFGGLPYDQYLFLLHLSTQGNGGLEHKTSCSLNYPRLGFRNRDRYNRFMQLVAHEFFHLWNVKRIRPKALEVFDYEAENYTPSLWFSEGTTSYYDLVVPLRAGIYDARGFLNGLSKEITRFQLTPGRRVQPLNESSFDAWIKLYRQDANSPNSQVSYYLKGELVSLLLDLLIRERHGNQRSLDDVLRRMWQEFGQAEIGFTPEQLWEVIESVAGTDLSGFHQRFIEGTDELPFDQYLQPFGLELRSDEEGSEAWKVPYLGITTRTEYGRELVKLVESGSPAQRGGIDPGDELLAIDGIRCVGDGVGEPGVVWRDRLKDYQPGATVQVTVFHQDELRTCAVTLAAPRPSRYQVVAIEQPDSLQTQNFAGWLGSAITPLEKGEALATLG